jgi:hypothetical protein
MSTRPGGQPDPAEMSRLLREQALHVALPTDRRVGAVLMEIAYQKAVATLVSFVDGTTSLYFSGGGGVIGAGQHQQVRTAAAVLLATAERHLQELAPTTETPLPELGRVRFYVRTPDGTLAADASETDLHDRKDPLAPVYYAAHGVIAAIRGVSEPRAPGGA